MTAASPRIALVLSGGGARGAYEAGVVRYLREELPSALSGPARLDIVCGTSVGAITACFLAATAHAPATQGKLLSELWTGLSLEDVYKVRGEDLWTLTRKMWRAATNEPLRPEGWRLYDILHPEFLETLVRERTDWSRIGPNIAQGHLSALAVTATEVASGHSVVFVQRQGGGVPAWSRQALSEAREAAIGPEHALASAAIPLLFRSVKLGDEWFCDGSLRQSVPLSPALRLGADKVLLISLRHSPGTPVVRNRIATYPTTPLLMGKVLNALMLDSTDYDLERLRRLNQVLEAGRLTFGEDFLPRMNETVQQLRGQPYRIVEDLVLRPSRDLASIAAAHARRRPLTDEATASLPTKLLHRVARSQLITEADLASYLLFDGAYASDLIQLGMEDAHAQREALVRFFTERGPSSRRTPAVRPRGRRPGRTGRNTAPSR
ncbi:patatin [Aggregicoccus sp. 17bor-14]|uniref:patatin-like phospholipase family protein n=1 Tax=Myxococcaceae TaxID=31 RepID=UPI00129C59DA|nr:MULTISPECIES: patatin-like phospholipase family protein [Myxococcaceae]MBF5044365.1 patatin-like phospholipase family protein [Simulacricoccus sp. 17bor-14]MRI90112.1 patatin [Aggregicoccus sp. 17bor-14]